MAASFFNRIKVESLDSQQFEQKLKETEDAILIDVRTEEENYQTRIPNSKLIDIYESTFPVEINKLDREKSYFVYCRSGSRSYSACAFMVQNGFKKVYNLRDGVISWEGELESN